MEKRRVACFCFLGDFLSLWPNQKCFRWDYLVFLLVLKQIQGRWVEVDRVDGIEY